jgi:hypothetical protein
MQHLVLALVLEVVHAPATAEFALVFDVELVFPVLEMPASMQQLSHQKPHHLRQSKLQFANSNFVSSASLHREHAEQQQNLAEADAYHLYWLPAGAQIVQLPQRQDLLYSLHK